MSSSLVFFVMTFSVQDIVQPPIREMEALCQWCLPRVVKSLCNRGIVLTSKREFRHCLLFFGVRCFVVAVVLPVHNAACDVSDGYLKKNMATDQKWLMREPEKGKPEPESGE